MSAPRSRNKQSSTDLVRDQHLNWLGLLEVSGPFLTLPVLRQVWPAGLDPLDKEQRRELRREHTVWQEDLSAGRDAWIRYVLSGMLGWGEDLRAEGLESLAMEVAEHDTRVEPSFVLTESGAGAGGSESGEVKAGQVRLLGLVCPTGQSPQQRIKDESWSATPVDRLAQLCRHHGVELGLATDGRWWVLVWAPKGGVTTTAVFDASLWTDSAERDVLRAFYSLLNRRRFFGVPKEERLVSLLAQSMDSQEEVTEALGVQVRQAVELLVAAIGRADTRARERGDRDLSGVSAHDVYRGSVSVMMRVVFLLFAEERGLLPSDNDLYARAYSAGGLYQELHEQAREGTEDDLERTTAAWHRLLALFNAVYGGVDHPRLKMHPLDGSLFNPETFPWMPLDIDDRTVLHMLKAVQYVRVGRGKSAELRKLSFRALDVEQIGYVYEGLLSFDGFRAEDLVVGLVGKEGSEEEVELRALEELAARHTDVESLAAELAVKYKDSKIGTKNQLVKRLALMDRTGQEEARKKLRGVLGREEQLVDRLLPFFRVIRLDLRGLPLVIRSGELYVTDSLLRKNTGTHYTPRFLAEEVVEGALEPLVYEPGPLQTANTSEWKLKSSQEILALKVADIAVGSAAFLVAAARYLGDRLIEAWVREGDERVAGYTPPEDGLRADDDKVVIEARRQVIEHSLYGVDINPMAVEMAKLSLWLVSMDPERPFTFLDDRLAAGDSLLGITSLEQIEYMHMDPKQGRKLHGEDNALIDFTSGIRELVGRVAESRRELADIDGTTLEGLNRKRSILGEAEIETGRVKLLADLSVGAALANASRGKQGLNQGSSEAVELAIDLDSNEVQALTQAKKWLDSDRPEGTFGRKPLHWPLTFPEVFTKGGFDAVIGNPPFLGGGKIGSSLGGAYRSFLGEVLARGKKAKRPDLASFFLLKSMSTCTEKGILGLITTNSIAQGDTREIGLDTALDDKWRILSATKSKAWPSRSAALEYSKINLASPGQSIGTKSRVYLNGHSVNGISPQLDPESRTTGPAHRLAKNRDIVYQGSILHGSGFILEPAQAKSMIEHNQRNSEVVYKFLGGEDVNQRPKTDAPRYVINFEEASELVASKYQEPFEWIRKNVKPGRDKLDPKKYSRIIEGWWKFWAARKNLYEKLSPSNRIPVIAQTSRLGLPTLVPSNQIFAQTLLVFTNDNLDHFSVLNCSLHYTWAISQSSTMKKDLRYTATDAYETFPFPRFNSTLRDLGDRLDTYRRDVMLSRNSGLTKTYNLVFDPECNDPDIQELRAIHRAIDEATIRAYGWEERIEAVGGLDHGFHPVGRETRYTIGPAAQREVLDSLLELNHERYAEEVAQGLHDKKKSKRKASSDEETLF